jgi:porphobilinogen synthase
MKRFRHLRSSQAIRDQSAEVSLNAGQFILPLFIVEGKTRKTEIPSMTDVFHLSADEAIKQIAISLGKGINKFLLFGVVDSSLKDDLGSAAWAENNLISGTIREIRKQFGKDVILFTDVCLCGYTSHGHCGQLAGDTVDNDSTLPLLAAMALEHGMAGADFVAPSAMMDGQVETIRQTLTQHALDKVRIMSYSTKYSSAFYGPFRDAVKSSPAFGDRKTYQLDYRTISQGLDEADADLAEGADWVMVKPAHAYLDMIQRIKSGFNDITLAAYHVSGEYMLLKTAAAAGLVDELTAFTEVTTAIKRAGADYIITYYADNLADSINNRGKIS